MCKLSFWGIVTAKFFRHIIDVNHASSATATLPKINICLYPKMIWDFRRTGNDQQHVFFFRVLNLDPHPYNLGNFSRQLNPDNFNILAVSENIQLQFLRLGFLVFLNGD